MDAAKLKEQIRRRISGWLNGNGIDTHLNQADHLMADEVMTRPLMWMKNR